MFEKVVGERDVITHVRCSLRMDEVPLLEAVAELPAPDLDAFAEYWTDTDNPLWTDMQDPAGFERPEFIQRDKLAPWAWSVLDKAALEAEGLAKWRAILAARQADIKPSAEDRIAALEAALRERVEARDRSVFAEAPLLPAPDALMSDYGPVGDDDITGDMLLDAFEADEAETVAVVQTLSALRLKHLSEQLNVERARLDREHQATGVANPRSASIDRLLGLLTRRGEV